MGPALRTDVTASGRDPSIPGPGCYNVAQASELDASKCVGGSLLPSDLCGAGVPQ